MDAGDDATDGGRGSGGERLGRARPAGSCSTHACGDCHGGFDNPGLTGIWMAGVMGADPGVRDPDRTSMEPSVQLPLDDSDPSYFVTRPQKHHARTTRPGSGASPSGRSSTLFDSGYARKRRRRGDHVDDSGRGNFPAVPRFLAPPMPWPAFRHMPDQDLWDIAAYLKRGLLPVSNEVAESEGPPDFWAGFYADPMVGYGPIPPGRSRQAGRPGRTEAGRVAARTERGRPPNRPRRSVHPRGRRARSGFPRYCPSRDRLGGIGCQEPWRRS